jgi:hypothetical protein
VGIYVEIKDFEGPLKFSPTKRRCHPMVRNKLNTTLDLPIEPTRREDTNESLTHKNATMKGKKRKSKRKGAHDEDSVGVDEESFYSYTESLEPLSDNSYDSDLAASSDSDSDHSDLEYNPDTEIHDVDDVDDVPTFSYDVDDPCIDVGVVFPDVDQCQTTVHHWCILNDHAYHTIKKAKERFRANCLRASEGCKCLFFASISKKELRCKVNFVCI